MGQIRSGNLDKELAGLLLGDISRSRVAYGDNDDYGYGDMIDYDDDYHQRIDELKGHLSNILQSRILQDQGTPSAVQSR